jgi:protein O-mannosyl-transferase
MIMKTDRRFGGALEQAKCFLPVPAQSTPRPAFAKATARQAERGGYSAYPRWNCGRFESKMIAMSRAQPLQAEGRWKLPAIICLGLVALTWFVFGQTLRFGFINYDDPEWVSANPNVTAGLTANGFRWAFDRFHAGPLSSLSHMLDCQLFGLDPWGHHLSNVLFHIAAVLFLFLAFWRMTGAVWRSAIVAALFAVHPLHVESVAWVTERKDVLSGMFFALTLFAYAIYARRPSVIRYLAVAGLFALGLLAKTMLITLPAILLLIDYWPLQRFGKDRRQRSEVRGRIVEKIPLVVLSLAAGVATFLTHAQGVATVQTVPLADRLTNAVVSFVIYIRQMLYPNNLSVFYGFIRDRPVALVVSMLALICGISAAAIIWRRKVPSLFVGWFWYLIMLLPVSGILQVGLQGHADRYTYLPQIGLYLALVWGVADLTGRWAWRKPILTALALIMVVSCAMTARQAAGYWRDSESLWNHAILVEPANDFAHASLADLLLRQGRVTEAISHAEAALRFNPDNADAHNNLALALSRRGRLSEAINHWERSLELHPNNLNARCNLAWVLSTNPNASTADGARALELVGPVAAGSSTANSTVLQILAAAYARSGRFNEAVKTAQQAEEFARRQGDQALANQLQASLALYEAQQPLRDETLVDKASVAPPLLARPQ